MNPEHCRLLALLVSLALPGCFTKATSPGGTPGSSAPPTHVRVDRHAPVSKARPPVAARPRPDWGVFVVEPRYSWIEPFFHGQAVFREGGSCTGKFQCQGGKAGILRQDGSILVPPRYDWLLLLKDRGYFIIHEEKQGFMELTGKVILEPRHDLIQLVPPNPCGLTGFLVTLQGRQGFANPSGKVILSPEHPPLSAVTPATCEGVGLLAGRGEESGASMRFFRPDGTELVQLRSPYIRSLENGFFLTAATQEGPYQVWSPRGDRIAAAKEAIGTQKGLVWIKDKAFGAIDASGRIVVQPRYDEVQGLENGLAALRKGARWTFVDGGGRAVGPPWVSEFQQSHAGLLVFNRGGTQPKEEFKLPDDFRCDRTGCHSPSQRKAEEEELNDPDRWRFDSDWWSVRGGKFGVMRPDGRVILEAKYDCVRIRETNGSQELLVVEHPGGYNPGRHGRCAGGRMSLFDAEGRKVLPKGYAWIGRFKETDHLAEASDRGLCHVDGRCEKGRFGIVDRTGKVIVPFRYDHIERPGDLWIVDRGEDLRWLDASFREVVPGATVQNPKGISVHAIHELGTLLLLSSKFKRGLADRTGRILIPPEYDQIGPLIGDRVVVRRQGRYGLMGLDGTETVKPVHFWLGAYGAVFLYAPEGKCGNKEFPLKIQPIQLNEPEPILPKPDVYPWLEIGRPDSLHYVPGKKMMKVCGPTGLGLLSPAGRVTLSPEYEMIWLQDRVTSVKRNSRTSSVQTEPLPDGRRWFLVTRPLPPKEGDAVEKTCWGLADPEGRLRIPCAFSYVDMQPVGLARVAEGGACTMSDTDMELTCTAGTRWGLARLSKPGDPGPNGLEGPSR